MIWVVTSAKMLLKLYREVLLFSIGAVYGLQECSYCKNNMFLIEVKNSFDGTVCVTEDGGLKSRKQDTHRHGLGFQNIVRCVDKYLGSADYTCCDRTFTLIVMLQKI